MKLDFAILADVVIPRQDGKLDIYGAGFTTIYARGIPATHPHLVVATRLLVSAQEASTEHQLEVVIVAPDGQRIARAEGAFEGLSEAEAPQDVAEPLGIGLVLNFENVHFPTFGTYELSITWDGDNVRPPIRLSVVETPAS
jgi:hypothetical protein